MQLEGFDPGGIGVLGVFGGTPLLLTLGKGRGRPGPAVPGVDGTG